MGRYSSMSSPINLRKYRGAYEVSVHPFSDIRPCLNCLQGIRLDCTICSITEPTGHILNYPLLQYISCNDRTVEVSGRTQGHGYRLCALDNQSADYFNLGEF